MKKLGVVLLVWMCMVAMGGFFNGVSVQAASLGGEQCLTTDTTVTTTSSPGIYTTNPNGDPYWEDQN